MSHKLTKRQIQSIKKHFENKELRGDVQDARRQRQLTKSQRTKRPPRQRDWSDADEAASREKMRRASALDAPAPAPAAAPVPEIAKLAGTVIEVRSGDSLVSVQGRTVRAALSPALRDPADGARAPVSVGDRVAVTPVDSESVLIVSVLPRRSALVRGAYDPSRRDPLVHGHVLAANIDLVVVVCSPAEPPFRPRLIDRYLVAASRDRLPVVVCLNKTDLGVTEEVQSLLDGYEGLGIEVISASAANGDVDNLRDVIAGNVALFTGHSGVGKSSLLNALEPGLALRIGRVTQATAGQGKGRHTTSSARLVPLTLPDTFVVDSPGIRAFGLKGLDPRELALHFPDIAAYARSCDYRDCLHRAEPGCAVKAAAHLDSFLRARLDSYRAILQELA